MRMMSDRCPTLAIIFISTIIYLLSASSESNGWKLDNRDIRHTNQDIVYVCPLNSMCHCGSLPNETSLLEINCNEVSLYKFPEFLHSTVKRIQIARTFLQNVDDETFQGLQLESLKLVDNQIQDFSDRCFSSMTHSLVSLDISGNLFQYLPLNAIKNIHTLDRLVAHRNHIQNLDGNWGNLVDSLRSLQISGNSITELMPYHDERRSNGTTGIGKNTSGNNNGGVSSLSSLSLSSSSSSSSPSYSLSSLSSSSSSSSSSSPSYMSPSSVSKTFSKLRKLVWLDLSANRIMHLSTNSLPRSLVTIDLSKNLLQTFPTNIVDHLHDLKVLSLKDNLIGKLTELELINRMQLEKLDLSHNIIEDLTLSIFHGNAKIRAINLNGNYLRHLNANTFDGCGTVHMVLAFNHIESIHEHAFAGLEDVLEYLDLERNFLRSITFAIGQLNRLRFLYFTSNEISHVTMLPATLHVLSLSGNEFWQIPFIALQNCTELSYLNMGYNKISDLGEQNFIGWGGQLQTLLLRNNKITQLGYGAFAGMDTIREISLSFNDIHYVHPNVFDNVSRTLEILELSFGIYREDFPMEALSPLTELIWLGLDNNNLKLIPDDSLATMRELAFLNMAFNRIVLLPRNMFIPEVHQNLREMDFSFNLIEKIFSNTFDGLPLLQIVDLASNKIRTLERHCFHDLPYLTYVDLHQNNLRNISAESFAFLPNILGIDLMENQLQMFTLRAFKHVSNATSPMRLNISSNRISVFDTEIGVSRVYIYSLDLSHNAIVDVQSFASLGHVLRVLYLNDNAIASLGSHAFGDLPFLEILNLAGNDISNLRRRTFQGMANLQELDLSDNRLEQLQVEQFSTLRKLRVLNLSTNRLRALPREAFLNTMIEFLDVSNNMLTVWPVSAFSDIGFTLRHIKFTDNTIEYLDSTMFMNTQFLRELNLSRNKIAMLPDITFMSLFNLTALDLSHNPILSTNFKELFLHTPRLKFLNLRNTNLYTLPQLHLVHIVELDISENNLQELPSLTEMRLLRILRIAYNKLVNLTMFGKHLPSSVRVLDLSGNPIRKITPHDFSQMRLLEDLFIENVRIVYADSFTKLHALRRLHISAHTNFGEIVSRLRSLRTLFVRVDGTAINDTLFASIINNTKLNLIDIVGPKVKTITSNAFMGFARNHELTIRLRDTEIDDLPPGIFYALKNIPRLTIDLSGNLITTLSPDSFYPNASSWDAVGTRSLMGGLDLYGNPLQCDCGLVWLGHWLRRWLRETSQANAIAKNDIKSMIRKARRSTCFDQMTSRTLTLLEIFPEDLLCHASALSSIASPAMTVSILAIASSSILIVYTASIYCLMQFV